MKRINLLAMAGLVVASSASADWQEVSEANNGSFYTHVESGNVADNDLAIYFDPDNQCEAHAVIFDMYSDLDKAGRSKWRELEDFELEGTMQSKIDQAFAGESEVLKEYSYDADDEFGFITYTFGLSSEYVSDLEQGKVVKFRFTADGDEYENIVRYPLDGSKFRLAQAKNACEEAVGSGWSDGFESVGEIW